MKLNSAVLGLVFTVFLLVSGTTAVFNFHQMTSKDLLHCEQDLKHFNFSPPTMEQYNEWKTKFNNKYAGSYALFSENAAKFACHTLQHLHSHLPRDERYLTRLATVFSQLKFDDKGAEFSFFDSPFAASTPAEFSARLGNRGFSSHEEFRLHAGTDRYLRLEDLKIPAEFPEEFDLRKQDGLVLDVLDQGPFGTCWAFSASQAATGQLKKIGLKPQDLSMQTSVECDNYTSKVFYADCGYFGGLPSMAMSYNRDHRGYRSLADFPYSFDQASQTTKYRPCMAKGYDKELCGDHDDLYCKPETTKGQGPEQLCNPSNGDLTAPFIASVDNIFTIAANDTAIMAALMQYGPLSIAVNAEDWSWYKTGVIDYNCSHFLNHAVLLVGWNTSLNEKGEMVPTFIVKNSWGPKWGEGGYVRLIRGKNMCGMNDQVIALTLKKPQ